MHQLYDYHIHSTYCDGKDTPEEMVLTAIEKGFKILGFSSHKYYEGDENDLVGYVAEIIRLKEKYKNDIEILLGIEQDYFSTEPTDKYDYVIGSVHYLKEKDESQLIDLEVDTVVNNIKNNYGGNYSLFAKDYFTLVGNVVNKTGADIIGHFDLCTKYKNRISLPRDDEYYKAAFEAIEQLIPYKKPFEINFGAIARGYRNSPYPDKVILKEIKRRGGEIIFNSDCHDREKLGLNYDIAVKHAIECGFEGRVILTKNGKKQVDF